MTYICRWRCSYSCSYSCPYIFSHCLLSPQMNETHEHLCSAESTVSGKESLRMDDGDGDGDDPEESLPGQPTNSQHAQEEPVSPPWQRDNKGIGNDEEENNEHWMDRRCCHRWPRLCSMVVGVLIPLWSLVFISLFFGVLLCKAEAPGEIELNDAYLSARSKAVTTGYIATNFTRAVPKICFLEYLRRKENDTDLLFDLGNSVTKEFLEMNQSSSEEETDYDLPLQLFVTLIAENTTITSSGETLAVINVTELFDFMKECGNAAAPYQQRLIDIATQAILDVNGGLSFNWIRCTSRESGLKKGFPRPSATPDIPSMRFEAQAEFYSTKWEKNRDELFEEYQERPPQGNRSENVARLAAYFEAVDDATGEDACGYNLPATAWFWFTVMTTVGYGNQAPETSAGRLMVFSLGFASLLAFGAVLARAGHVLSAIVDDILVRLHWRVLTKPWPSTIMWGTFGYTWMLLIAYNTDQWKKQRVGEPIGLSNAYWFAFISTTTIGLGDIYLDPEVIVAKDLFYFPFTFLIGFSFFSAFLGKLAEAFSTLKCNENSPSLVDSMLGRMEKTELNYGTGTVAGISDGMVARTQEAVAATKDAAAAIVDLAPPSPKREPGTP